MRADPARRGRSGLPAGAADQRGRAALPGRRRGRAVPDRRRGAGGGDRHRAEPGQRRAAGDRARGRHRGRGGAAGAARGAARGAGPGPRRRGLAPGRDRDRRLAAGRAPPPARRRHLARRRGRGPRLGAQHPRLRPARRRSRPARSIWSSFGGHRAAAGLELRAENLDAFREAFAAHAAAVLGPEDLRRTERIDAMVGGAGLGLDLAEELRQLAPFGMGNPGVRLLVPSARVRDVRTMGGGQARPLQPAQRRPPGARGRLRPLEPRGRARTIRSTPRCGSRSTTGTARSSRGWSCASSTRATAERRLRRAADAEWWERFEAELAPPSPGEWPPSAEPGVARRSRSGSSVAATIAELLPPRCVGELRLPRRARCLGRSAADAVACGRAMVAVDGGVRADRLRRARTRTRSLPAELRPRRPRRPAAVRRTWSSSPSRARGRGGRASCTSPGGEAERRFALSALGRAAGPAPGADRASSATCARPARRAARTCWRRCAAAAPHPRGPEAAARCFRVLAELGLVQGAPDGGGGTVGVVSSEGTDLERSAAFRAYSARYQEGQRFLEGRKQP